MDKRPPDKAFHLKAWGEGMRVLVACEYSAVVRDAFRAREHDAWSCDLLPTEGESAFHIQGDAIDAAYGQQWDMMIAHPPCTRLSNSGVKHLYLGCRKENGFDLLKYREMEEAAQFFNLLKDAPIKLKAIENPVMHRHAIELTGGAATQYVQPWMFGVERNKATGFRLTGLPKLIPTDIVGPMPRATEKGTQAYRDWNYCWYMSPGPQRGKERARTEATIANAMAEQWGNA